MMMMPAFYCVGDCTLAVLELIRCPGFQRLYSMFLIICPVLLNLYISHRNDDYMDFDGMVCKPQFCIPTNSL